MAVALLMYGSRITVALYTSPNTRLHEKGERLFLSSEEEKKLCFLTFMARVPSSPLVSFFSSQVTFLLLDQSPWPRELCSHEPALVT